MARTDSSMRMNNMRSQLLLAMLLCAMLCVTHVQTEDDANKLKLCGRAFVRAVVYTCGGSRWRRRMGEEDALQAGENIHLKNGPCRFVVNLTTDIQVTFGPMSLGRWREAQSEDNR